LGLTHRGLLTTMPPNTIRKNNMKNYIRLIALALCFGTFVLLAPASSAQNKGAKLQAISQQLNLTPQQKAKVLPILADEGPKVEAIKNNSSLSGFQKMQQIRAIHQQTDPQMKAILSPDQYQKLQAIRQQAIQEAMQKRRGR
jgi:Spy/CpxP family protein refolding chaperone